MIRRPPRSTPLYSSAASDVYKRQTLDREADSAGQQTDRRAALAAAPWDGWTGVRQQEGSAQYARSPDVGRTDDAQCRLYMGTGRLSPAQQVRYPLQQASAHGSWGGPMGMSTEAQTGPLNCLGMGGTWAHVGNAHRKANWTANVQAGMCTRVAHGVSVTLFLHNCAIR